MLSTEHSISYEHSVMFAGNFLDTEMNTGALTLGYKHIFQNVHLLFCAGMYHLQITSCLTYTRLFWMVFLLMLQHTQVGQIVHFFQLLNCCGVFENGYTVSRCISLHILSILLSYIMLHLWILQWIQIVEEFAFFFATKASLYFFFSLGLLVSCNAWAHHSSSYKYSADAVLIFGAVSISEQPLIFWISENKYLISFCKHFKLFILCGFFLPPTSILLLSHFLLNKGS